MGSEETRSIQSDSVAVKLRSTSTESSPVIAFDIALQPEADDDEYQCHPGDQLTTDVVLVLASPLRLSAIVVELQGEASVAWKADDHAASARRAVGRPAGRRGGPAGREACSRWYHASELYVDERQDILLDAGDDVLQPGEHRFPVSFQLPGGLPSSFRGRFGGVSYVLRASFVDQSSTSAARCLAPNRYVVTEPFLVRHPSPPPPPQPSQTPRAVSVKLSRRLFAALPFMCASGLLRVDFTLADGTTYRLGDDINVVVQVDNDSPRVMIGVEVALVQVCEYRAQRARRRCVALVSRRRDTEGRLMPVGYADPRRCTSFRLSVPPDIPESRLDGCDIIEVGYELRFAVEVVISLINN